MKNRVLMSLWTLLAGILCGTGCRIGEEAPVGAGPATRITHVDAVGAKRLIAEKKVVVLDIRTPREYAAGHIAGAVNIDFRASDFENRLGALDKDQTYLVHCASGNRSTQSLKHFRSLGFQSIAHLDGGMNAWREADEPVVK